MPQNVVEAVRALKAQLIQNLKRGFVIRVSSAFAVLGFVCLATVLCQPNCEWPFVTLLMICVAVVELAMLRTNARPWLQRELQSVIEAAVKINSGAAVPLSDSGLANLLPRKLRASLLLDSDDGTPTASGRATSAHNRTRPVASIAMVQVSLDPSTSGIILKIGTSKGGASCTLPPATSVEIPPGGCCEVEVRLPSPAELAEKYTRWLLSCSPAAPVQLSTTVLATLQEVTVVTTTERNNAPSAPTAETTEKDKGAAKQRKWSWLQSRLTPAVEVHWDVDSRLSNTSLHKMSEDSDNNVRLDLTQANFRARSSFSRNSFSRNSSSSSSSSSSKDVHGFVAGLLGNSHGTLPNGTATGSVTIGGQRVGFELEENIQPGRELSFPHVRDGTGQAFCSRLGKLHARHSGCLFALYLSPDFKFHLDDPRTPRKLREWLPYADVVKEGASNSFLSGIRVSCWRFNDTHDSSSLVLSFHALWRRFRDQRGQHWCGESAHLPVTLVSASALKKAFQQAVKDAAKRGAWSGTKQTVGKAVGKVFKGLWKKKK